MTWHSRGRGRESIRIWAGGGAGHDETVSDEIVMDGNLAIEVVRAISD